MMGTALVVVLVVAAAWFFLGKLGGSNFWALARKFPDRAWAFFETNPHWHTDGQPAGRDVVGPFFVTNPTTGEVVKIYCDADHVDQTQREFTARN